MAGVAILVRSGVEQQGGGQQVIRCSVPASLAAFDSLSATGPGSGFIAVTKINELDSSPVASRIAINSIVDVIGT